jgi:hypothetical protein
MPQEEADPVMLYEVYPFYPQEQTSSACPSMSVWCQRTNPLRRSALRAKPVAAME